MMNIPWHLKSRAFRILSFMPDKALYLAQRYITGNSQVRVSEIDRGWLHHAKVIQEKQAETLIEFGAGKTLVQNLYLSQFVKKQTVIDLFAMLELPLLNQAATQLRALGVPLPDKEILSLEELEEVFGITYIAPFDARNTGFETNSFDICVSTNTLEHIPKTDIVSIFKEMHRILKPGGTVSAMIDYSDHYAHSDKSLSRLHYLQYSEQKWKRHNHSNHYQNRMRHGHYRDIFTEQGFVSTFEDPTDVVSPDGMTLLPSLLTASDQDYATTGFWVLSKEPPGDV